MRDTSALRFQVIEICWGELRLIEWPQPWPRDKEGKEAPETKLQYVLWGRMRQTGGRAGPCSEPAGWKENGRGARPAGSLESWDVTVSVCDGITVSQARVGVKPSPLGAALKGGKGRVGSSS